MPNDKVRIGILGAGSMGTEHEAAYAVIPEVEVVGVFSRNPERARALAQRCGAAPYSDAAALIKRDAVDMIDVCLLSAGGRARGDASCPSGKPGAQPAPRMLMIYQEEATT